MPHSLLFISPRRALLFCLMLSLFELLVYVGSDIVMPGMLTVVADLKADVRYVPWSMNAYLLGGVALQWIIGPLSDRFGRRPLILIGCAGFAFACVATPWVASIEQFMVLRFVQGIGLGFVIAVSYPAIQESFSESDSVRLFAIFSTIGLLSPMLGPMLGTALLSLMTWQVLFIVFSVVCALVWLGLFYAMPETIGVARKDGSRLEPQPLRVGDILRTYGGLLHNRRFMAGTLALGLAGLPLLAWIALSPVLLMHNLNASATEYALWQLPVFGAMIIGNVVLNCTIGRFGIERLLALSLLPLYGGLALALIATLLIDHIVALVSGLALYAFGLGICNATLYRLTLFSSQSGKGAVAAMLGMIPVGLFALGISLLAALGAGDGLADYITAAAAPAFLALLPTLYVLDRALADRARDEAQGAQAGDQPC
ncbi:MAG: hypothetical protein K0R45_3259 [Pseudomonas sp.]|nr:hypothetical protein [Pseudomonas sp.]